MLQSMNTDILIIGSGATGLTAALSLAEKYKVTILSKQGRSAGATRWAQGGIAAVLEEGDSYAAHIEDTILAGAGLNHRDVVTFVVESAPRAIAALSKLGVPFTRSADKGRPFHLTKEGGHSHRRIVHVDDATGKAIHKALVFKALQSDNIHFMEHCVAVDLATNRHLSGGGSEKRAYGAYVWKEGRVIAINAPVTILATGGASHVYQYSTNPDSASGDGIAMAWRAGCRVANMEFNQFHPTCLYHPQDRNYLITEAARGEGGLLRLPVEGPDPGELFMHRHDPRKEMAPRDLVARAIDSEMKRLGLDYVHLDMTHLDPDFVRSHFPNIHQHLLNLGIDMTCTPVPVVPAAHYTCGGIVTDLAGRTDLPGLYAIGETAHTGLHGANRIASNSLLECLVFGHAAAEDICAKYEKDKEHKAKHNAILPWDESRVTIADEEIVVSHNWAELRRFMWDYVGIVRTNRRLERAANRIALLQSEIIEYYGNFRVHPDLLELRNLVEVADLIVRSARMRKESRGLHFTTDYPDLLPEAKDTILSPHDEAGVKN